MKSDINLFRNLLLLTEKLLTPLGTWPVDQKWSIQIIYAYIFIKISFAVLVVVKILMNPESESAENAITLSNGGFILMGYYIPRLTRRDKFMELVNYIKIQDSFLMKQQERDKIMSDGREYRAISIGSMTLLAAAGLLRFIFPIIELSIMKLTQSEEVYHLPPSLAIPDFLLGELVTYIIETIYRFILLSNLIGVCSFFILATLHIETKFYSLALKLESLEEDDDKIVNALINEHNEILEKSKTLNKVFSPFFFSNCVASFINCSVMLFSLMARNVNLKNSLIEIPLVMVGMGQLYFLLYFGERLIGASSSISAAAFRCEWFKRSIKNQKKIQFIIMRAQRPQTINVGNNFLVASIYLFSEICQKAWATFNLLRTTIKY